jgi:hypothetical protein
MSTTAKILSLSYDSAVATKTSALKTNWRSVRLIKNTGTLNPKKPSYATNILLNGKCIDPENRNLYLFYIDTYFGSAWIIEINIDSRVQTVVLYDKYNAIGFDPLYKIYNARVVHGRIVWTDNKSPIYQIDIARAKRSFLYKIGYGQYPVTEEWSSATSYGIDQIVSNGNNFYKSLTDNNINREPRGDNEVTWQRLCLIEDAYYSTKIENYYFEPIPPKHPPEVTYQADDIRKINNLKQTLFQFAYRYVYMDWRKSTFSPASIVPVPQAEEETVTGLANEQISLNNKLQIVVNSGGEEVRAIEVVGRSSSDPSKWYLIETLSKFESQERGYEISRTSEAVYIGCSLTLPDTTTLNENDPAPVVVNMSIVLSSPSVVMSWVHVSKSIMGWTAAQSGSSVADTSTITCSSLMAQLTVIPSWITVCNEQGFELVVGMSVNNNDVISIFPKVINEGPQREGYVTLANSSGDSASIRVIQAAVYIPPVVPVSVSMAIDPLDTSGMTLGTHSAQGTSGSAVVSTYFTVNHPFYTPGQYLDVYWRATVNGAGKGSGVMVSCVDEQPNTRSITLSGVIADGDTVVIYLSAEAFHNSDLDEIGMSFAPQIPIVINSVVVSELTITGWTAAEYGLAAEHTSLITCTPSSVQIVAIPSWLKVLNQAGFELVALMSVNNGDTVIIFPRSENLGGALTDSVVFTNSYGDTASIIVNQAAAVTPPVNEPVDSFVLIDPFYGLPMTILTYISVARSFSKSIMIDVTVDAPGHALGDVVNIHWRTTINGAAQGYGDITMINKVASIRTVMVNVDPLVGDTIIIYLSHT